MSPATSAVISGNIQTAPNSRMHQRDDQPALGQVRREREVPAALAVVAEVDRDDEQDRDDRRRAEPEVGPLLVAELQQLPPVHGRDARPRPRSPRDAGTEARRLGGADARAHRDASAGAGAPAGAPPLTTPSPSVSEKNRSSSVTVCGASEWMSAPASISACDSSATAGSSAAKEILSVDDADVGDPGLGSAHRDRALVVGRRQPVGRAGAALEVGDRTLVHDLAGADDRHPVAQLLDLGQQVAGEQHGHPLVGQPPDQQPHVAHSGGVEPGGRLVEQQQLRIAQQRRGDPEPLAHPVRVAADPVARPGR